MDLNLNYTAIRGKWSFINNLPQSGLFGTRFSPSIGSLAQRITGHIDILPCGNCVSKEK